MTAPHRVEHDPAAKLLEWIKQRRRLLIASGVALAVVGGGVWFTISARERKERFGASALAEARAAANAGNLALAASDLSRLANTFAGSNAAQEASILLAQIRLLEGQPAAAVTELRKFIAQGPNSQFLASAYGLLGTALDQANNPREAAESYLKAVDAAWYDFLKAQYLIDAARTLTQAGDTARAARSYQRVMDEFGDTDMAVEAKLRLAELNPSSVEIGR
ncbi:MAG: tol-pal system YbgF family protein [Gemmatimonadales bacterium]